MRVADDLRVAARADPRAAQRLGYLVGAARRGAAKTPGLAAQLARRIEQTARSTTRRRAPRCARLAAGEAGG